MTCNIGTKDRIFRYLVTLVIAGLGIYYQSWWGLMAIPTFAIATVRFCPVYLPFHFSTVEKGKAAGSSKIEAGGEHPA